MTCGPAALATSPRCVSVEVCDTVRGPPSRYPGEFQLAAGNSPAFPYVTPGGSVVVDVVVDVDGVVVLLLVVVTGATTTVFDVVDDAMGGASCRERWWL